MNVDDREKKAFDFTADLTKQLITLSTGIVTLTLLLSKDLAGPRILATCAWTCFLLSTLCGLWAMMALTGTLAPLESDPATPANSPPGKSADNPQDIPLTIGSNVRIPSILQIGAFGIAICLTLSFVFATTLRPKVPAVIKPDPSCVCTPQH